MFRIAAWTLRQPRYAALAAGMLVVAVLCALAGTWQISRFNQSVRDNNALGRNAHASAVALTTALVPLVGQGRAPGRDEIRFRTVTVSGTYLHTPAGFVRNETLNGENGYYLLSPLRTATGVLLVVRGFVEANAAGAPPAAVAAPPTGLVHITGRLQTPATKNDDAARLGGAQLESVNPAEQSERLGAPVYDAYVTLDAHQPGTSGVSSLPDPNLSNPAGGAYEWQHFAYIVQWYLFALLALSAPFAIGRSEARDAQRRFLGIDSGEQELGLEPARTPGRDGLLAGRLPEGTIAVRESGRLALAGEPTAAQLRRANRLADRYGRSLGVGYAAAANQASHEAAPDATGSDESAAGLSGAPRESRPSRAVGITYRAPNSATQPHRSRDGYHGSYNDYLWELSLADGAAPSVAAGETSVSRTSECDEDELS